MNQEDRAALALAVKLAGLVNAAKVAVEAINELIAEDDPFDMPPPWLDELEQAIAQAEEE